MGIEDLLEMVTLKAEMQELKANPNRAASGAVIEARLDKGRGPVATLLVQNGTLHQGDIIIAGTAVGRIRAMVDDKGRQGCRVPDPLVPVEITGHGRGARCRLTRFNAVADERMARDTGGAAQSRRARSRQRTRMSRKSPWKTCSTRSQSGRNEGPEPDSQGGRAGQLPRP